MDATSRLDKWTIAHRANSSQYILSYGPTSSSVVGSCTGICYVQLTTGLMCISFGSDGFMKGIHISKLLTVQYI